MSSENNNQKNQQFFTDDELKEKEKSLLRLFKDTLLKYNTAKRKQWLSAGKLWPLESNNLKNQLNFKNNKISIKVNDHLGTVVIWGKKTRIKTKNRNMKLIFPLDTEELILKTEVFMEYPVNECSLIKNIFKRLDIKTKEDYRLLLSSFESLIISYI